MQSSLVEPDCLHIAKTYYEIKFEFLSKSVKYCPHETSNKGKIHAAKDGRKSKHEVEKRVLSILRIKE